MTNVAPSLPGVVERPRGITLHPGDLPSDEELRADEQARVEARLGSWLQSGFAQARAQNGLPDPAYGVLGRELRAATAEVPAFIDTNSAKEVATAFKDSWLAGAERYGKTGAPYAEPEGRLESIERPSALADAMSRGSPDALALGSFLSAGARLQEFADGRAGLELYALVEIRQNALGAVEHVELVRPSGLRPFDAWVTERAGGIVVTLGFDAGARERALRSVWRFDGILKFRRAVKPGKLDGRAALGMITMTALSMLSGLGNANGAPRFPGMLGRFDEVTGEMDVVDLTNPTYDCKVTLVEAD
ncbi:MAG: hypothetical protein U0228_08520 [Myxococcaceae bacterium]